MDINLDLPPKLVSNEGGTQVAGTNPDISALAVGSMEGLLEAEVYSPKRGSHYATKTAKHNRKAKNRKRSKLARKSRRMN